MKISIWYTVYKSLLVNNRHLDEKCKFISLLLCIFCLNVCLSCNAELGCLCALNSMDPVYVLGEPLLVHT